MGVSCISESKKPIITNPIITTQPPSSFYLIQPYKQHHSIPTQSYPTLNHIQLLSTITSSKYNIISHKYNDASIRAFQQHHNTQHQHIHAINGQCEVRAISYIDSEYNWQQSWDVIFHNLGCFLVRKQQPHIHTHHKLLLLSNVIILKVTQQQTQYITLNDLSYKKSYAREVRYLLGVKEQTYPQNPIHKITQHKANQILDCYHLKKYKGNNQLAEEMLSWWDNSHTKIQNDAVIIIAHSFNHLVMLPQHFDRFSYVQYKSYMLSKNIWVFDKLLLEMLKDRPICNISMGIIVYYLKWVSNHLSIINNIQQLITMKPHAIRLFSRFITLNYYWSGCQVDLERLVESVVGALFRDIILLVEVLDIEFGIQIMDYHYNFRKDSLIFLRQKPSLKYKLRTSERIAPSLIIQHTIFANTLLAYKDNSILEYLDSVLKNIGDIRSSNKSEEIFIKEWKLSIQMMKVIAEQCLKQDQLHSSVVETTKLNLILNEVKNDQQPNTNYSSIFNEIYDRAMKEQYISSQLLVFVLTLSALRSIDSQQYLLKVIHLLHCQCFDPRVKYASFQSYYGPFQGAWESFIIKQLIENRKSKRNQQINPSIDKYSKNSVYQTQRTLKQQIYYLENMYDCIAINGQSKHLLESLSNINVSNYYLYLIQNAPNNHPSTLYHSKQDMWEQSWTTSYFSEPSQFQMGESVNSTSKRSKNKPMYNILQSLSSTVSVKEHKGVITWGNKVSIPTILPAVKQMDIIKISCGNLHTVMSTRLAVYGYGQNNYNQLTNNSQKFIHDPIAIIKFNQPIKYQPNDTQLTLTCGNYHTAILLNGVLRVFGNKQVIQGDGQKFDRIASGGLHTVGIRDGKVYSWGRGEGGQLGHPLPNLQKKEKEQTVEYYIDKPLKIQSLSNISKVVCGDAHTVCLDKDGQVFVFGFCYQGQLGLGITGDGDTFQVFQPVLLDYFSTRKMRIADIFAGGTYTFFKTQNAELYGCGLNDCNQLGVDRPLKIFAKSKESKEKYTTVTQDNKKQKKAKGDPQFSIPKKIQIFDKKNSYLEVKKLCCGESHSIAEVTYNSNQQMIMGWGDNRHFQVTGDAGDTTLIKTIDSLFNVQVKQIACGSNNSIILTKCQEQVMNNAIELLQKLVKPELWVLNTDL